jgi:hypothetical protein
LQRQKNVVRWQNELDRKFAQSKREIQARDLADILGMEQAEVVRMLERSERTGQPFANVPSGQPPKAPK